jgi:hypothetical protein
MHFHLPKPLHGWRELAGEIGIIVVGVLIALSFEQLAVTMQNRSNAHQAREAVRAEVSENLWWLQDREDYEPCIDEMLGDLATVLTRARNGEPTPVIILRNDQHRKLAKCSLRSFIGRLLEVVELT